MYDLSAEYRALAQDAPIDWERLEKRTVLITGATGLIGSCCARLLLERNRAFGSGIHVIALVRNLDKAHRILDGYAESDGLEYCVSDLSTFDQFETKCDFIIHAGCPTASRFFMEHPVETAGTIVDGTRNMIELAIRAKAESFVYVSSMEVYGDGNDHPGADDKLGEHDVGYVDPLSVRSCYPEGKRMAELLTCAYAAEYGVDAKIARLAQTFGPGIPLDDKRVFAQFARCAIEGEDIVLKTTGESTRMYNYTTDAVVGLFTVLLRGAAGQAYNVANEQTYSSVREMAQLVADNCADGAIAVKIEVDPNAPYPPEHHLPLDTGKLQSLGWAPKLGLEEMYDRLIDYLR
ncbi:MAG: NAD-dependent epimerase/dehydratase family protein [Coriobacteriales bacterium]|jgi:UDP-glucuronate decarboxylase